MKKILFLVIATVLFSSCGNQLTVMKRHYNKGFYVHHSKSSDSSSDRISPAKKELAVQIPAGMTAGHLQSSVSMKKITACLKESSPEAGAGRTFQQKMQEHIRNEKKEALPQRFQVLPVATKLESKSSSANSGSDVDLLILVILCLFPFINLIAIYLKDGKDITMNFWICLILDILFFLPGIIFALLVVLDVINLG